MNRLAQEDGFTLAELLVGAMLAIIVLSASLTTLDQFRKIGARTDDRVDLQDQARETSRELARSLRNIAPSPVSPAVIDRAGAYDLIFHAVDRPREDRGANSSNLKRVRYCLDASDPQRGRLLEQTQRWNSATPVPMPTVADCPATEWGSHRLVADRLTNRSGGADRPLWTYKQNSTAQITGVKVNLFLNDNPALPAQEVALQTGIFLRNQNRAPK